MLWGSEPWHDQPPLHTDKEIRLVPSDNPHYLDRARQEAAITAALKPIKTLFRLLLRRFLDFWPRWLYVR